MVVACCRKQWPLSLLPNFVGCGRGSGSGCCRGRRRRHRLRYLRGYGSLLTVLNFVKSISVSVVLIRVNEGR